LEEFAILTADCYQSPESIDPQAALIIPSMPQSLIAPATNNSVSGPPPVEFGPIDALTSETSEYNFIFPTSFKLPSNLPQSHFLSIDANSYGIKNNNFIGF
jgi:hypothetical protein